jgi:hypothetical protein
MVIDVLKYMTNMSNRKKGMRKGGNLRQKSQRSTGNRNMITHPPSLGNFLVKHSVRVRYVATAAFAQAITYDNLLDLILIATAATTGATLFHRVRIRGIEMWGISAVGTPTSVSAQFNGSGTGTQGDGKFHTDTSMGIQPAHLVARPVKDSFPDLFQNASGATAFTIEGSAGTVIDLMLSYQQLNGLTQATGNPLIAAVAGTLYWRGLDALDSSTTNFPPPANLATI